MIATQKVKRKVDVVPKYKVGKKYDTSSLKLADYEIFQVSCGLHVVVVPRREIPIWDAVLINPQGSLFDPKEASGCLNLATNVIRDGVKWNGIMLGKQEFTERIERMGGIIYSSASKFRTHVGVRGLSRDRFELMEYLFAATLTPTFDQSEFERERQMLLAQIATKFDSPDTYASEAFRKFLYGEHPLGQPTDGTMESLQAIACESVANQWHRVIDLSKCYLSISGDCDSKEWKSRLEHLLSSVNQPATMPKLPEPTTNSDGIKALLLNRKDARQATIHLGHRGVSSTHPDLPALQVLEHVLFNGMSSRFFKIIRAKHGLTYGIGGSFARDFGEVPFQISTATAIETTGKMLANIIEIIENFQQTGPTDAEMFDAKSYVCGSYPLGYETASSLANDISMNLAFGLSIKEITDYRERIEQVTKAEVIRVAREHIRWNELRIVIDGVAEEIIPQLEKCQKPMAILMKK